MVIAELIIVAVVALIVLLTVVRSVRIIPQARARNVERFGRYRKTLEPGLNFIVPFVDRVKTQIDLREQVVSFDSQPVITEDNLVVQIDTVLFFQVTDPRAADYEIVNYILAIEQLTATMLRSVIGSMDLEQTLTSRDKINTLLRGVLDDASGKWGIRVTRVEIKAIDPPKSVKDAMEKQMRAEREKRAAILTAEGARQSQILTAEGDKTSKILRAEGDKQAAILRAEGEAQAITPGLRVDPPQRPGPEAARLPVPADPAAACQRRGQHVLGDPERGDDGAEGGDLGIQRAGNRARREPGRGAGARDDAAARGGAVGSAGDPEAAGAGRDRRTAGRVGGRDRRAAGRVGGRDRRAGGRVGGTADDAHRTGHGPREGAPGKHHAAGISERKRALLRRRQLAARRARRAGPRRAPRPWSSTRRASSRCPRQRQTRWLPTGGRHPVAPRLPMPHRLP